MRPRPARLCSFPDNTVSATLPGRTRCPCRHSTLQAAAAGSAASWRLQGEHETNTRRSIVAGGDSKVCSEERCAHWPIPTLPASPSLPPYLRNSSDTSGGVSLAARTASLGLRPRRGSGAGGSGGSGGRRPTATAARGCAAGLGACTQHREPLRQAAGCVSSLMASPASRGAAGGLGGRAALRDGSCSSSERQCTTCKRGPATLPSHAGRVWESRLPCPASCCGCPDHCATGLIAHRDARSPLKRVKPAIRPSPLPSPCSPALLSRWHNGRQ